MKILKYLLIVIAFIPLFIFRDFTPNNELKYLSIADEAIRNGHLFTFWNHGMVYADKPPLYLWIIMYGKLMFLAHNMLFIGMFSILPALVVLYVMDKWTLYALPSKHRTSGQLMLITSGLFTGSAIVLRMDMLMCMFIVLSLYTFYKIYTYQDNCKILLPVYIFLAVFTKGPVGIVVPLLSITAFLLVKKEIKHFGRYFGWKELGVLLGLCALWFGAVYAEGGDEYLNNLLFHQTVNRAIDSFHHKEPFYYYFITIWYSLAPWVLFYFTTIVIGIKKRCITTDIEKLFLTVIVTTFVVLSAFSGKLDIYLLPIFPFCAYLAFLLLPKIKERYVYFTIAIPALLFIFAFPAMYIVANQIKFPFLHLIPIHIAVFSLSACAAISLFFLYKKDLCKAANSIAIGVLIAIFTGSFAIPEFNRYIGFRDMTEKAQKIALEKGINHYYFYKLRSGENMDAYLQKEIEKLDIEMLEAIAKEDDFILFAHNKDLEEDDRLKETIDGKQLYSFGDYSIIIFYTNRPFKPIHVFPDEQDIYFDCIPIIR